MTEQQLPVWADPSVSPAALDAQGVSRRQLLRRAGLFGAAFALGSAAVPAAASQQRLGGDDPRLAYLVGDHHIHTVYSHDAKYTFSQLATAGAEYGLDWMVFTEHSNFGHAKYGAPLEHKEILEARAENPRQLIFQGLEWYIPAAEHCTVFAAPGPPRGRPAHPVRERLRRQAARLHRRLRRRHGHRPQRGPRGQGHPVAGRAAAFRLRRRRPGARQPPDAPGHRLPARNPQLA